jgi:hypothetical protein
MITAMTSFISKMGLRHTTTTSSAATSVSICHNVGSDAWLPMTMRCFVGHPDHLTWPWHIFLWGYVKDKVFVPPVPRNLPELRRRIIAAISQIDRDMLQRVWAEMDYRFDV